MNWLDIVILVVLVFNVYLGLQRGLIRSVFGLIAVALGLFVAVMGTPFLSSILAQFFVNDQLSRILAFVIFFLVIYLLVVMLGKMIHDSAKNPLVIPLNLLGGGLIGFLKGTIILLFFIVPVLQNPLLSPQVSKALDNSKMLVSGEPLIIALAPMVEFTIKEILPKWQIQKAQPKKELIKMEAPAADQTPAVNLAEEPSIDKLKKDAAELLLQSVIKQLPAAAQ